jgi:hypothetical protein
MTFLLSEDEALRKRLQGMVVHDQRATNDNTPRPVSVFFGQPDQEIRNQTYPYITIDMIDIQRDTSREMRGLVNPDYLAPDDLADDENFLIEMPIPVNIDYQLTTYSRQPRHDREILAQLLGVKLPIRFGQLEILEKTKEVDGTTTNTWTYRRLEVTNVVKRDVTEQAKRLFVNAITVRVSSEIVQGVYRTAKDATIVKFNNPADLAEWPLPPKFTPPGGFTITE